MGEVLKDTARALENVPFCLDSATTQILILENADAYFRGYYFVFPDLEQNRIIPKDPDIILEQGY